MIAGIDEVGTGSIAGPLVAAVVIIDTGLIKGVRDSKLVGEEYRYVLGDRIQQRAKWFKIASRSSDEINASSVGACWKQVVIECSKAAHAKFPSAEVQIDGAENKKVTKAVPFVKFVVNGDDNVYQIGAASLVAKAHRDLLMIEYAKKYPGYGWDHNKGYPTPEHLKAIRAKGMTPLHRIKPTQHALFLGADGKKIVDPAQEVADFSMEQAKLYIAQVKALGLKGDWEIKFLSDLDARLSGGSDLTPRQKFFLKRIFDRASKRSR